MEWWASKNCSPICYDRSQGRGCDLVLICEEKSHKNTKLVVIIEFKECNLNISDVDKACEQIKICEEEYRSFGGKDKPQKYFIHIDRNCEVPSQVIFILKNNEINYISLKSSREARSLYNIYRKQCKDRIYNVSD